MSNKNNLKKRNYYSPWANKKWWSASFVKSMLDCPNKALAELNGDYVRQDNTALLVGSYVDSYFDGKKAFNEFVANHPEIYNSRSHELKADYKTANQMIERALSDKVFMSYLKGQRQKIFTGNIGGIPFRCKLDFYKANERIVDLKTVKDLEPMYRDGEGRVSVIEYWRWDLQMAIYQELCYQNTGNRLPCYLAIVTKQEPSDLCLVEVPQHYLDTCMELLLDKLPVLKAMRDGEIEPDRCDKCDYCRASHKITEPVSLDLFTEI